MTADPIRVVLVDDHPLLIDGLRLALDTGATTVVGVAGSAAQALAVVAETAPDVVLMDLHLPDGSGIEATQKLRSRPDAPAVLVLTMSTDHHQLTAALDAGAGGYLVKGASRDEIVRAVQAVAAGQLILDASVADAAAVRFRRTPATSSPLELLTAREREVLTLLASGHDTAAIARHLHISTKTAANHLSHVLTKLGAADRTQAALMAVRAGWVDWRGAGPRGPRSES